MELLKSVSESPVLALLGAGVLLVVILIPVFLRLAGLSGAQIIDVLAMTGRMIVDLVRAFREENSNGK